MNERIFSETIALNSIERYSIIWQYCTADINVSVKKNMTLGRRNKKPEHIGKCLCGE